MGTHDEPLRDRLIAQQELTPEKLSRYRKEVEALLEQLRRRKWWIDAVRAVLTTLGAIVLVPLAVLFGLMFLYLLVGGQPSRRPGVLPRPGSCASLGRSRWCGGPSGGARMTCCWKSSGSRPRGSSSRSTCGDRMAAEAAAGTRHSEVYQLQAPRPLSRE